ncbi:hypothetical protein AeRB84_013263 [Aphanomyces euteiches]|nr:hypothetical protein AeRB84_013263 [Aphanomyces euteiches]
MRLLFSLALAMSGVVAFNELHQDTPVMLAHQGAQMRSAVGDLRVLQSGKEKHAALEMSSEETAARRLAAVRWNIPGVSYGKVLPPWCIKLVVLPKGWLTKADPW